MAHVWYNSLHIYHQNQAIVGNYTSPWVIIREQFGATFPKGRRIVFQASILQGRALLNFGV